MPENYDKDLVTHIDIGKDSDGKPEGCVLIYRYNSNGAIELVLTSRCSGDSSLILSPSEVEEVGRGLLSTISTN